MSVSDQLYLFVVDGDGDASDGFALPVESPCSLPYDYPPCDCIDQGELFSSVAGWYGNMISMSQLMTNIGVWKVCDDE